jgi:hypothetical protein
MSNAFDCIHIVIVDLLVAGYIARRSLHFRELIQRNSWIVALNKGCHYAGFSWGINVLVNVPILGIARRRERAVVISYSAAC